MTGDVEEVGLAIERGLYAVAEAIDNHAAATHRVADRMDSLADRVQGIGWEIDNLAQAITKDSK
jgi:hypothetical protein